MKIRDEVKERWGLIVPDEEVLYEDDDQFVTKSGMGVQRNVELFWRNQPDYKEDKDA